MTLDTLCMNSLRTFYKHLFSRTEQVSGFGCVVIFMITAGGSVYFSVFLCLIHRLEVAALCVVFSQNRDRSQKVYILCGGSPTG